MDPQVLQGFRVIDVSGEVGQLAGRLLADFGAEVIKVEPPGGDPVRSNGPFYRDEPHPDNGLLWWYLNLNKKSVTLDVSTPHGGLLLRRLVSCADVLIESFQPGYLRSLGLDSKALHTVNPTLVMASITGFGQDGPYSDYRWSDIVGCALGGSANLNGDVDRAPLRLPESQAYRQASLQGALGIMMALFHRHVSGRGQHLDISMQEAVTQMLDGPGTFANFWRFEQKNLTRLGASRNFGEVSFQIVFKCKDGYVANSGLMGRMGRAGMGLVPMLQEYGAEQDLADPKWARMSMFAPGPGQVQATQAEIDHISRVFQDWSRRYTKKEGAEACKRYDLMIYPVNDARETLESEQLNARGFFVDVEHPKSGTSIRYPGAPFIMSRTPLQVGRRAPMIGEHNVEVFEGLLGLGEDDLIALKAGAF